VLIAMCLLCAGISREGRITPHAGIAAGPAALVSVPGRAHDGGMSWVEEALPLPAARPVDGDEPLEAAIHALAALAAGIAAVQLMLAVVLGEPIAAAFFIAALLATGACAFVGEGSARRRVAFVAGGSATVLVWLAVLPQAPAHSIVVVLGMAGVSAAVTRHLLTEGSDRRPGVRPTASIAGWTDDDVEGELAT